MGVQTVEVTSSNRPGSLMTPASTTTGAAATGTNDVEKGAAASTDQWGKNMQRWRNDNIDIGKGS